jgi:protein TonB
MRATNANVPRGESLAAILPWLDDTEEARRGRTLRRGLALAASVHLAALSLPLVAPEAPPPRVVRLEPFRLAPTPRIRTTQPPDPAPPRNPRTPEVRATPIPMPGPAEPELIARPLEVAPVDIAPWTDAPSGLDAIVPPDTPPADPDTVVDFGAGIEAPVRLGGEPPRYTELARRVRAEGTVIVEAVIDRDGRVVEARALKGLPYGLTESALAAVASWRFTPASRAGRPLAVRYRLTVVFGIR